MIRRLGVARANTYDEVRGAVLDALNIAEDEQVPERFKLRVFDAAFSALIAGQAIHEQIAPSSPLMQVPRHG